MMMSDNTEIKPSELRYMVDTIVGWQQATDKSLGAIQWLLFFILAAVVIF